jgi:hypothetical protein
MNYVVPTSVSHRFIVNAVDVMTVSNTGVSITGTFSTSGIATLAANSTVGGNVIADATDIALLAPKASPTFTGTPLAPTATLGNNSTQIATTAFVNTPNVQSVASAATVTAAAGNDMVVITAQAAALTLANPTGTWLQGQGLVYRIKDNGTARTIAYGTNLRALGVTRPTTTVISKTLYIGVIYNATDTKWDIVSVSQEA